MAFRGLFLEVLVSQAGKWGSKLSFPYGILYNFCLSLVASHTPLTNPLFFFLTEAYIFEVLARKENIVSLEKSINSVNYKGNQICNKSFLAIDPY